MYDNGEQPRSGGGSSAAGDRVSQTQSGNISPANSTDKEYPRQELAAVVYVSRL